MIKNMKETLKEIAFWIVAILALGMFTCFFSSCGQNQKQNVPSNVIVWSNMADVYTFVDDGCTFITGYRGGFIHHPTCNNPKHSCSCYIETYE